MRTVAEHRDAVLALVAPLGTERCPVGAALGRVLGEPLVASGQLPHWDCSAMDGYAVRAADAAGAGALGGTPAGAVPVVLTVVGEVAAGSAAAPEVGPGQAVRIMTGAPVPPGADAVVPVEDTDGGLDQVAVRRAPAPGAHVRRAGEDVRPGEVVLVAGQLLGPAALAAAASVGVTELVVRRRPRVAVVSTGSELVPAGVALRRGQIHDSNSTLLAASAAAAGAEVVGIGSVVDDVAALRAELARHDGTVDLVVTSGGVSVGAYDVVKELLAPGVAFVTVAMQPGKPQGAGLLPGGTPVLCLPGNPVSAHVSFEVFVRPVLRRLAGAARLDRPTVLARAAAGWRPPAGRAQYMPVVLDEGSDGLLARPAVAGGSGSHLVAGLARADGLAVVPQGTDVVDPGTQVVVMRTQG